MSKRIILGQQEWIIPDDAVDTTVDQVKAALEGRSVVALGLLDGAGRAVTVYLNGGVVGTVVIDLDSAPRPGEMSG